MTMKLCVDEAKTIKPLIEEALTIKPLVEEAMTIETNASEIRLNPLCCHYAIHLFQEATRPMIPKFFFLGIFIKVTSIFQLFVERY